MIEMAGMSAITNGLQEDPDHRERLQTPCDTIDRFTLTTTGEFFFFGWTFFPFSPGEEDDHVEDPLGRRFASKTTGSMRSHISGWWEECTPTTNPGEDDSECVECKDWYRPTEGLHMEDVDG